MNSNSETLFRRQYCIKIQSVIGKISYAGSKILSQVYVLIRLFFVGWWWGVRGGGGGGALRA